MPEWLSAFLRPGRPALIGTGCLRRRVGRQHPADQPPPPVWASVEVRPQAERAVHRFHSMRLTWPTSSPRRSGATAAVCSTRTWISSSPMVIMGRKRRGGAEREDGATKSVESNRSSDCTMTPYLAPRCSLPRAGSLPRAACGARSLGTSPPTQLVHLHEHPSTLRDVDGGSRLGRRELRGGGHRSRPSRGHPC